MKARTVLLAALIGALAAAAWAAVQISEYRVPTPGAFPHDPAADSTGSVYFTEMMANKIGRFDPKSGAFAEFKVPTAHSGPHGIVIGADGIVTFTEIDGNKIGRFDPKSETFHEFPAGNATRPHTPLLVGREIYFTAPGSDAIGRLDPASGRVATFAVPTPNAVPYGIKLGPDGALYFTEFGSNKIGWFDLRTDMIKELATPTTKSAPRRLWLWNDFVYFTEFNAGKLGRMEIRDHTIKEWLSPGGPDSLPYGIAIDRNGQVWYEESASATIVHFDPANQSFTTVAMQSQGAVVRNMDVAPDGRIWMALSGADRIAVLSP